jgi:hypothetical protein
MSEASSFRRIAVVLGLGLLSRDQTRRWLDRQHARLLPGAYFLLTYTLPAELRALARWHPKLIYRSRRVRAAT